MTLTDILEYDNVQYLEHSTKKEALNELMDACCAKHKFTHMEALREEVFYREKLLSTGLGLGLAIPHVRSDFIDKPIIHVGLSLAGITDYASLDNVTIQLVFLILVGKHQQKEYLVLLSQIVNKVKSKAPISAWLESSDRNAIYQQLIT